VRTGSPFAYLDGVSKRAAQSYPATVEAPVVYEKFPQIVIRDVTDRGRTASAERFFITKIHGYS
jgi:hypothetical protein